VRNTKNPDESPMATTPPMDVDSPGRWCAPVAQFCCSRPSSPDFEGRWCVSRSSQIDAFSVFEPALFLTCCWDHVFTSLQERRTCVFELHTHHRIRLREIIRAENKKPNATTALQRGKKKTVALQWQLSLSLFPILTATQQPEKIMERRTFGVFLIHPHDKSPPARELN